MNNAKGHDHGQTPSNLNRANRPAVLISKTDSAYDATIAYRIIAMTPQSERASRSEIAPPCEAARSALRLPSASIDSVCLSILESVERKVRLITHDSDRDDRIALLGLVEEIHQRLAPLRPQYNSCGNPVAIDEAQTTARNHLGLTAGVHRALARQTRAPLKRFKALGIEIAGLNLDLSDDPDHAIPLTHEHYLFMRDLPWHERQGYRVVVVPASDDPYFFEALFRRSPNPAHRTGFDPVIPPSPLAYTELIRLEPLAESSEGNQFGSLQLLENLVTSSVQAIATAELSALRRGQTIFSEEYAELRAFAGYSSASNDQYLCQEHTPPSMFAIKRDTTLRHFSCDNAGVARPMACSLEWRL
jgi:hypothetical protein